MKNRLDQCWALCQESQSEIRMLSYVLHPALLDDLGLVRALNWYIDGFVKRTGIDVRLDTSSDIGRLPLEMETDLFRVVQEALTNIRRHSGSQNAAIRLDKLETQLVLQIEDRRSGSPNEVVVEKPGFDIGPGVGIPAMRERLRQYGGSIEIRSESNGTTLIAIVPLGQRNTTLKKSAQQGQ